MKRSPIKAKSAKRTVDDRVRKRLRAEFLEAHPACEMRCGQPATDVDELIGRGVLPGAQLMPELFQALCRTCHGIKTTRPDWSYRHGWSAHEWDLSRVDEIRRKRICCPLDCEVDHINSVNQLGLDLG